MWKKYCQRSGWVLVEAPDSLCQLLLDSGGQVEGSPFRECEQPAPAANGVMAAGAGCYTLKRSFERFAYSGIHCRTRPS